jgi:DNA-directed RNA polymerase II subunit RPB4
MGTRRIEPEQDANQSQFGPEFQDCQCLLISEVKVLLEVSKNNNTNTNEIVNKTFDYCMKFSRFNNKQTVKQIRSLFDSDYHPFEMAQLANLTCESVEEACYLIPSLSRIPIDELQSKLNELGHLRKYQ